MQKDMLEFDEVLVKLARNQDVSERRVSDNTPYLATSKHNTCLSFWLKSDKQICCGGWRFADFK